MIPLQLTPDVLYQIQKLIQVNFAGRDELFAAAETLDDNRRKKVVYGLANHLADHAIELQQILLARGEAPLTPTDMHTIANALFDLVKENKGSTGIIAAAENCEQQVIDEYAQAIEDTEQPQVEGLLRRQQDEMKFDKAVLDCMQDEQPTE